MRYFLILFLLISFKAYPKQRIFYDNIANHQITDIRGNKTLDDVGPGYTMLEIDETFESYRLLPNGELEKYNLIEFKESEKQEKVVQKELRIDNFKTKHNIPDTYFEDLKEALND